MLGWYRMFWSTEERVTNGKTPHKDITLKLGFKR